MEEELAARTYDEQLRPCLIYLPGLHGDWTLIGDFRKAVAGRAAFVEFTYPRSLTWSLDDYAEAIERALQERNIDGGWLLAESFGSQVAWQLMTRARLRWDGIILAGGFGRYPIMCGVRLAGVLTGLLSEALMKRVLRMYSKALHLRYRRSPEVRATIDAFLSRRTDLDRRAAMHRLDLILRSDPSSSVRACALPIYALTGFFDPIVPWILVRRWFRRNCSSLRDHKVIWRADHTVLATAPRASADQILRWTMSLPAAEPV